MFKIEDILQQLQDVDLDTAIGPTEKKKRGDKVIGTMTDEQKRLFVLNAKLSVEISAYKDEMLKQLQENFDNIDENAIRHQADLYIHHGSALSALLWYSIESEFGQHPDLKGAKVLFLCENWTVVARKSEMPRMVLIGIPEAGEDLPRPPFPKPGKEYLQ